MRSWKRILAILLACVLCLSTFSACGKEEEPERSSSRERDKEEEDEDDEDEEDEENGNGNEAGERVPDPDVEVVEIDPEVVDEIYGEKLRELYYSLADIDLTLQEPNEDLYWLADYRFAIESTDGGAYELVGYAQEDLSGDGIPELIIGSDPLNEYGYGTAIFNVYTIVDGECELVVEGWGRNRQYILSDGVTLYNEGSAGAASSGHGIYNLSYDGTEIEWQNFYFSEYNGVTGEIEYYNNDTGEWDPANSEQLDITEEEFWEIRDAYAEEIAEIELTPFYKLTSLYGPMAGSVVTAEYLADTPIEADMVDCYDVSIDEYPVEILMTVYDDLEDFAFCEVEYGEDRGGEVDFTVTPVLEIGDIEPYTAFVVAVSFPGDMPTNAISYTDAQGEEHMMFLTVSGEDGSVFLQEWY